MRIDIIDVAGNITQEKVKGKTVIIIDVLRATSVMTTALANGVKAIYPYKDIESVLKNSKLDKNPLLCGERKGLKIEGFDCGNSPLEYPRELVEGRNMYMTTSNGTRAIEKSADGAERIYISAFLNVGRVAKQIVEDNRDVVIVCSGTDDNFSLDDALCAGEIIKRAVKEKDIELSDMAIGLKFIADNSKDIPTTLKGTKHYEYLKSIGFTGDMEHCFTMDKYDILPFYNDGKIIVKE